jgi:hypothetical protein
VSSDAGIGHMGVARGQWLLGAGLLASLALHVWSLVRFPVPFVDEAWLVARCASVGDGNGHGCARLCGGRIGVAIACCARPTDLEVSGDEGLDRVYQRISGIDAGGGTSPLTTNFSVCICNAAVNSPCT